MQEKGIIRIAVDAMGGDFAPAEVVKGSLQSAREIGAEIIFVGNKELIEKEIGGAAANLNVSVVHAGQVIEDNEQPALAVMRKPDSSIAVAMKLIKEGKADAMLSAGPTGALMVGALQYLGALPGVDRPVMGGAFLGLAPHTIVLDLGANVGCQPYQLVNFAVIGVTLARSFYHIENPTVGLLNVGAEEGKGDPLSKEAYALIKKSGLNFIGNVEGMDIPLGKANVIVCDGFTGNVLVKFSEGLGHVIKNWITSNMKEIAGIESGADKLYRLISPGAVMGGGPLLGVNGVVCKAHGRSRAAQISGTIQQAKIALDSGFIKALHAELERVQKAMEAA
ncbi:MAG TPA: phosphate acyltransferase PlsX [Dehalococcoidia bacterium]|nr:phosphate acyltransferase PlsX [Dehalococcoidia bacterium]